MRHRQSCILGKEQSAAMAPLSTRRLPHYHAPPTLPAMTEVSTYAILQYMGTAFAGWQLQPTQRTVQGEFEAALRRLAGNRVVTRAAGRTDAGVHALGQVVSFEFPQRFAADELLRALRALLPPDIWVERVGRSPDGFDARRHAVSREYRYVIGCDPAARSPFRRPFEWALGRPLQEAPVREAVAAIVGRHDFRAFSARGQLKPHYECNVVRADWRRRRDADGFIFEIEADRFLHRMVRFLVGTLVDVGRGRRPVEDVARLLKLTDNADTSPPAPPEGLYLVGARYPQLEEVTDR